MIPKCAMSLGAYDLFILSLCLGEGLDRSNNLDSEVRDMI